MSCMEVLGGTAFPAGSTPLECIAAINATVIKVLGGGGGPHIPCRERSLGMYCNRL